MDFNDGLATEIYQRIQQHKQLDIFTLEYKARYQQKVIQIKHQASTERDKTLIDQTLPVDGFETVFKE